MSDRIKEWDEYFSINCHLPAAAILDLFEKIERLTADVCLKSELLKNCREASTAMLEDNERLDQQLQDMTANKNQADETIIMLQARVEVLDKVRVAVLKHRDNKAFLNVDTWNACVYAAEKATEQGEKDE
jgi:hypothetical protein